MKKVDATRGPLLKSIILYTLPLILTTLVQNLFSAVDTAVLGNMANTSAVASVGATSTLRSLILNGVIGISAGTSTVLARVIGQCDKDRIRKTTDTSIILALILGVFVAVFGVSLAPLLLRITNCPADCYDGALTYLRIYVAAAPATVTYNFGAAVLRASGDTKRPMMYITVSSFINVIANIILCLIMPNKVAAVAIATALSKVVSATMVLIRLTTMDDPARVNLKNVCFDTTALGQIVRYGIPPAISQSIFPLANLQIVPAINSFGVDAVAGNAASNTILEITNSFTNGFSIATTTFMAQNIGACNRERAKKSLYYCLAISVVIAGTVGITTYLTGEFWLSLIIGASASTAISYGMIRLSYLAQGAFIRAINNVFNHAMQAYGYPIFASVSQIFFTLIFRIIWMQFIYPLNPTFPMIIICFIVSWTLNMIFYTVVIIILTARYNKGLYKKI